MRARRIDSLHFHRPTLFQKRCDKILLLRDILLYLSKMVLWPTLKLRAIPEQVGVLQVAVMPSLCAHHGIFRAGTETRHYEFGAHLLPIEQSNTYSMSVFAIFWTAMTFFTEMALLVKVHCTLSVKMASFRKNGVTSAHSIRANRHRLSDNIDSYR